MEDLLKNASEGDVLTVVYDKTAMNGKNSYEDEMTVRVTDANPHPPSLLREESTVAVVSINDDGEPTKNTGYIGMNSLGGCEMKPDNSYFPAERAKSLRKGDA